MGFGLVIGFIGLLQLVTTNGYSVIASSHALKFALTRTKYSISSLGVAWQRIPTMSSSAHVDTDWRLSRT
jgi:hypothetical protein